MDSSENSENEDELKYQENFKKFSYEKWQKGTIEEAKEATKEQVIEETFRGESVEKIAIFSQPSELQVPENKPPPVANKISSLFNRAFSTDDPEKVRFLT